MDHASDALIYGELTEEDEGIAQNKGFIYK